MADLLYAYVAFRAGAEPDWEAARRALDEMTRADMLDHEDWPAWDDEDDFRDQLNLDLMAVEGALGDNLRRDLGWLRVGGYEVWLAGGMSMSAGDNSFTTDLYEPLNRLSGTDLLEAAGAVPWLVLAGEDRWADDSVQFPRLLAEIIGVGLSEGQWDDLTETMGLTSEELSGLFDRAQAAWENAKDSL